MSSNQWQNIVTLGMTTLSSLSKMCMGSNPKDIISLQITAKTYLAQVTRMVDFLIVDRPSSYNVILGRPTLNHLKVVTSTYCLKVKFLTPNGSGEIIGDQLLTRECYQAVLAFKDTWMVEEETPKPMEEVENVVLVEGDPSKTTKVGKELQQTLRD